MANLYSQGSGEGVRMSPRSRADSAGAVPERRDVYERLADELRQSIQSGRYKPGDRLPSTLELMERTGVANLTVRGAYRVLPLDARRARMVTRSLPGAIDAPGVSSVT